MKYYDSDRTVSLSCNKEIHMAGEGHDATDFRYFKSGSTDGRQEPELNLGSNATNFSPAFHENNLKAYFDMDVQQFPSKGSQPTNRFQNFEHRAMRPGLSRDPKGVKNDVSTSQYLCAHATKALKVPSSTAKDRHSKVITLKGHRDRRVRLAVSTAIQLYNLQDRLGLAQPSKALDWLMSKAKPSIDELHRPSSISELKCSSCNSNRNGGATVQDILSTTSRADGICPFVPKSLASPLEKTQSKMGSSPAFLEQTKVEDLNVAARNVVCPSMLQSRVEASAPVAIRSDTKRSSLLLKNVNTQGKVTVASHSRERSGCLEIGFNCFQSQVEPQTDTHDRWTPPLSYWETADRTDPQIILDGNPLPFAIYSSHVDSGKHTREINNFSVKSTASLVSSSHNKDHIYADETLRPSRLVNSYVNTYVPQLTSNTFCERITSSSTMDSTEGIENGGGNGLFYFERGLQ